MTARRVLITGARAAAALDLARDFAAAGWDVHAADSTRARVLRWSGAAVVHAYPSPRREPDAFRAAVAQLMDHIEPDLVVPVCEEVFHLAAPELGEALGGRLAAPPRAVLTTLHDKLTFARRCSAFGVAAPETHRLAAPDDIRPFLADPASWVFKPRFGRFGDRVLISPSAEEAACIRPSPGAEWLAQRRVRGDEASFYAVAREGRLIAFCAYRSDWRLRGGAAIAFEPVGAADADRLREAATRIAQGTGLTGQFACDAILNDDGAWLIECNPRATSGVHLVAGRGDLAGALADGTPMPDSPAQPAHLGPAMALFGLPDALRRRDLDGWRRARRRGREVLGSPRATLGALTDAGAFALAGLASGTSLTAASTADIEWNGDRA